MTNTYQWQGEVQGSNTVDRTDGVFLTDHDYWDYEVWATGEGRNKLTVKLQHKISSGWRNSEVFELRPGQRRENRFRVVNSTSGDEEYRWRVSRKLGTKRINYTILMFRVR